MISTNRAIYVLQCLIWCGITFLWRTVVKFVSSVGIQAYNNKRVSVACSSFISRLMDQFSFWELRLLTITTFTLCSTRTFSDVLESLFLKNSSGSKPPDPIFLPLLFHCKSEAYTPPVQKSLRACCWCCLGV